MYNYLQENWEGIAFIIFFGAMFIGATIFTDKDAFEEHLRDEKIVADMPALAATNLADIVKGVCDGNQINKEL